jgi:hypothetical protein
MTRPRSDRLDAYIAYLASVNPAALQIWAAEDEESFSTAVEGALEHAIAQIEAGARLYSDLGELQLSLFLAQLLVAAGVPTTSEGYHNGHVDLTIRQPLGQPFVILGECKLYRGFQHHRDGCAQLLLRYSSGRWARTFCLDFVQKPGMYEKLSDLRKEFDAQRPLEQIDPARDHRIKGAFLTAHRHVSAAIVEVLHLGCNVFHPDGKLEGSTEGLSV